MCVRTVKRDYIRSGAGHGNVSAEAFGNFVQQIRTLDWCSPRLDIRKIDCGTLHGAVRLRPARINFGVESCWTYSERLRFCFTSAIVLSSRKRGEANESLFIIYGIGDWRVRFVYDFTNHVIYIQRVLPRGRAYRD